jgi:putative transposase
MKKSKFKPQQIVQILKEWESGKTIEELARQHGVSTATLYSWRKRFSGMETNDL